MILTLLIPWKSGERISFAVTVLLSIIVFLLIVSESLPKSENEPLLSRMIIGLIYFSLISLTFTIIISTLHNQIETKKIKDNQFVINLFENCNYIKCCINKKILKKKNNPIDLRTVSYREATGDTNITTNEQEIDLDECQKFVDKIEKLFIFIFLVAFVTYCFAIFLSVPKYSN